ncbi:MAG TPA: aspartyl protease family protein [Arachidicoccus soli]|uniref:Signal protein PDZ n=1 Tax=Arachidicoccus soli TaxID=2341117 RepID=A0A386HT75_9BACT|nr:aspartyl protease family protein [Arachidicoccus soli]AYD48484.1 signal protein PDZ [Arachidicoccus soli]HEU0226452.1 aspartyl protease family protein [Arachidicoccus soli]
MKPLLFFTACLLLSNTYAQKRDNLGTQRQNNTYITSFPFTLLTGGIILTKGSLDNYPDSLSFIMDTGCSGASLDSTTCAKLKIPLITSDMYLRGVGSVKKAIFTNIKTLKLPGIEVSNPEFHVIDYALLSEIYGIKIDGIIGYSFFKKYIVQINYDSSRIYVFPPKEFKYPKNGELLKPSLNTLIPIVDAELKNNKKVTDNYYFDMGAGLCLLLSNQFVADSAIFNKRQSRRKIVSTTVQGLTDKINMRLTTIKQMKIGHYTFRNIPTYAFDDISQVTHYPYLGGLIGNDLLRRFNVTLNYPGNEIFLAPNSHFFDPFDYSYTGLTLYFIDGQVKVSDVVKGSPADKIGILPEDVIMSVNNNLSNKIQIYSELLKKTGTKANIILMRDGQIMKKTLPIKSIL